MLSGEIPGERRRKERRGQALVRRALYTMKRKGVKQ
jgi:hypothetical protein